MIKLDLAHMANEHSRQEQERRERERQAREYSESVKKSRKEEKVSFLKFLNNATAFIAAMLLITSILLSGM